MANPSTFRRYVAAIVFFLTIVSIAYAKYSGGTGTADAGRTGTKYVFLSAQSTVTQTGGIAGVHETYSIQGEFYLTVNFGEGTAFFDRVDAELVGESPFLPTRSLGDLFNMTGLIGKVLDKSNIFFLGRTTDGTDGQILLLLSATEQGYDLTGGLTPPGSDLYTYAIQALAKVAYSGGSGTAEDPYQIATPGDLIALGETPEDYDKHFILSDNIDLDPNLPGRKVFDKAVIAPDTDQLKDDFQGTSFTGVFDGNGHTMSHLTIRGTGYLGLFGQLAVWRAPLRGFVRNLGVVHVNITGSGEYVGGLVGINYGTVNCCYSTGTVASDGNDVGGLVGANRGAVADSYTTGKVSANDYVGGLVGANGGAVADSYSTGKVSANDYVGGLVGNNWGSITSSYTTGGVSGNTSVGGLVGQNFGYVLHGVWDMHTSGLVASAGGVGLTTAEMMDPYMLGLNGFANDPNWVLDAGRDYPRLAWEGTPGQIIPEPAIDWVGGAGTPEDPYRIETADQLITLGKCSIFWDRHSVLAADIDLDANLLGRQVFTDAPIPTFVGVFEGNGHTISHLTIEGGSYLALFGYLGTGAEVKNLGVVAVKISGSGDYVGGLVAQNGDWEGGGTITNCYSTGSVNADRYVGGLVGMNYGRISTSYSTATVDASSYVGGLVGGNSGGSFGTGVGRVTGCYSSGAVSGSSSVGGLVGTNGGSITTSQSTATVSANWSVGGLVGVNWGGSFGTGVGRVTDSYSTGLVNGGSSVGGLVGRNEGSVKHCYSSSTVSATGSYVGGLAGNNDFSGDITHCYSTGTVTGNGDVGGLVGNSSQNADITHCYSNAPVSGEEHVGGLVGDNTGTVAQCYSTGSVSGNYSVGGLVGFNERWWGDDPVTQCFWDTETSGQATSAGGTGKTTAEMQRARTFLEAGWDFADGSQNGTGDIWAICEGGDYPHLAWEFVIGDFDADADTDFADFCILAEHWLAADGSFWCGGGGTDLTNDGNIDFADLKVMSDNWLERK
jgi:hypothetical protein